MTKEQLLSEFLSNIKDNMIGEDLIGIVFGSREELMAQAKCYPDILIFEDYEMEPELIVDGKPYTLKNVCCTREIMIPLWYELSVDELIELYTVLKTKTNIPCSLNISCKKCSCT